MVRHQIHSAFKGWFKEESTESDGTPLLPGPLSKKYAVQPQILGQGSFAIVKAVVEKATGVERALKIIAKKPLKEGNDRMLQEEINILGRVEHPNIIKMWDLYETKDAVFIVTDLCKGGELFDRLVEKVHYNELDARHIVRQLIQGVAYLHAHDIIHRDLKPENILLRDHSEPSQIVISDFGLSKFIPEEGLLMTACGSPQYVAPEVLLGKGYGPPVDIWSSGVIAYCLLAGYTPFYGEDQPTLFQQILAMRVDFEPEYWSDVSETAKDFILRCLCPAEKRMTPEQALAHPWLADLPDLNADTPQEHRGKCLKDCAQRHKTAKEKVTSAVSAMSAVAYLEKLAHLREQQADEHGLNPDSFHRLLRVATHVSSHSRGESSIAEDARIAAAANAAEGGIAAGNESTATITPESSQDATASRRKPAKPSDSGMHLDNHIMPLFNPPDSAHIVGAGGGNWSGSGSGSGSGGTGMTGTARVAEAAMATAHGENPTGNQEGKPVKDSEKDEKAGDAEAADATKALKDGTGYTDGDAEANGDAAPSSPARSSSSMSDITLKPSSSRPKAASRRRPMEKNSTLDALLDQYRSSELPSSARVDLSANPQTPEGMTLAKAWRYVPLLVNSGISIGSAIASHAIYGPAKKSWGIEMSIFTRIMRDMGRYTEFATIDGIQQFFELSSFLPVPKDGLITPVTFRVKKRNLRGLLAEADAKEDGTRELTGEWVVGKQTWKRLQTEWRSGNKSKDKDKDNKERVILYIHGGAYFVMSATTHRPLTIALSKYTECRIFGINYRLAPGCQFPGALHDVVSAWFRLVDDLGIPPSNVVLAADSAGGGLALALMYYLRDNKYDMPSGAILFSPWVDLTISCDSWETNSKFDYLPMPPSDDHMNPVAAYLGPNVEKYITHPYASPLFGDMRGLPPLLIQSGDAEVLRDEITLLAHKASASGVAVRHELYEDCVHVFQAFLFLEASRKALQSARHFVRTALDKRGKRKAEAREGSRRKVDQEMRTGMENERGERVEPRTGEKQGSYKNDLAESDSEATDRRGEYERSDDDWDDFDKESGAAKDKGKAAAGPSAPRPSAGKERQREGERTRIESAPVTPTERARRGAPPPMSSMSLSQARDRAQAAMRAQEHGQAPPLSRFHDPKSPLKPRLRRSVSNVAVDDMLKSFASDPSTLHTRVYTSNNE